MRPVGTFCVMELSKTRLSTIEECDKIFRVEDGKITDK